MTDAPEQDDARQPGAEDAATHSPRLEPPRPKGRASRASAFAKLLLGRRNLFSALNDKLYRGWLGRSNLLVHQAYLVNQPDLVRRILVERPGDFPKSPVMRGALGPLLGDSVFLTNGAVWERQRRMIDPAFAGGKIRQIFPMMAACAEDMVKRLAARAADGPVEIDPEMTHVTADVIFRTLFSTPIAQHDAYAVFEAFGRFQRAAPFASPMALLNAPSIRPRWAPSKAARAGREIRALLLPFIERREAEIAAGTAPDDLATAIMTTEDPESGHRFDAEEMLDQVAIFFLAGHETSASALTWTLYLLALDQPRQARLRAEAQSTLGDRPIAFEDVKRLRYARDVFREALRLYPPVPFFVRRAARTERMRDQTVPKGSSMIVAPWYLQRHERLWEEPHLFWPERWETENGRERSRDAYLPFSSGARVCSGAAFAMQEAVVILAEIARRFRIDPTDAPPPEPVMQVTLRPGGGVRLGVTPLVDAPTGAT